MPVSKAKFKMRSSRNRDPKSWISRFNVPEHIRHDEESHVAAANVDLVEMGDTAIASGDSDVLELNVHVILGCGKCMLVFELRNKDIPRSLFVDRLYE